MHETKTDEEVEAESSTQDSGPYSLGVSAADGFQGLVLTEISIDKMQIRQNQLVYNGKQSNTVTSFDAAYAIVALSIYQRSQDALPVGYASADGYREERFSLPNNTVYPVTVKTRLLYRIFPQWVTDAVQVGQPDLPTPPIVELMSLESQFSP